MPMNWPDSHWIWAPDVMKHTDGNYYYFYCQPCMIHCGVSETPRGPWKNILGESEAVLVPDRFVTNAITLDGQTFVDDDGSVYLYWGTWGIYVADFIGESNIVSGTMIRDELVEIFGARFACVDKGFGNNQPVDVVIRPEDIDLVAPSDGTLTGVCTHLIFKGVHYEMEVTTPGGFEWLVHSTDMCPVGKEVGIHVDPFDIQIMNKPASEDEEAVGVNE